MFLDFADNMKHFISLKENKNADGTINWNFVDGDMYMKWGVVLDGETYDQWFEKVANWYEPLPVVAQ